MNKKYIITTALLLIAALIVTFWDGSKSISEKDPRIGKTLFEESLNPSIAKIEIVKNGEQNLTLSKSEDGSWQISSDNGFPADVTKIVRFLDELAKTKIQRLATDNKEKKKAFGFEHTSSVALFADKDTVLKAHIGDQRKGGGQYFSFVDENKVYLAEKNIDLNADISNWEYKTLLDVGEDEIKQILFHKTRGSLILKREKKEEDLTIGGLNKNETEKSSNKNLKSILKGLRFSKRYDVDNEVAKTAMLKPTKTTINLFDGRTFEIQVGTAGKDDEQYFAVIQASKGSPAISPLANKQIEHTNQIMKSWYFEIPSHVGKKFTKNRSDLVETAAKKSKKGA